MERRALLVGSNVGLKGTENDVAAMACALVRHRFAVDRCTGSDATRAGILERLERLVDASRPGDAALIYYSGHGGCVTADPARPGPLAPRFYQFLVPVDFDTCPGEFRGILDIELARILAGLTARTPNVTVMLDCCHGEGTVRGRATKLSFRSKNDRYREEIAKLLARIDPEAGPALDPEACPHAVTLAAARPGKNALERVGHDGVPMSVMTRALTQLLGELGAESVTWEALHLTLVARMHTLAPEHPPPQLGGPRHRHLFALSGAAAEGTLPLELAPAPHLGGGWLSGVAQGDRYAILPLTADPTDTSAALAVATVEEVQPDRAGVALSCPDGLPMQAMQRSLSRSPLTGLRAVPMTPRSHGQAARIVRSLASGTARHDFPLAVLIEWGRVHDGERERQGSLTLEPGAPARLDAPGAALHLSSGLAAHVTAHVRAGETVYITVTNRRACATYWNVVDVDIDDSVRLATRSTRAGIELMQHESYTLGSRPHQAITGIPVAWPAGVPQHAPLTRTFALIASDHPVNLSALETARDSGLEALFPPPDTEQPEAVRSTLRYAIARLDLVVAPHAQASTSHDPAAGQGAPGGQEKG